MPLGGLGRPPLRLLPGRVLGLLPGLGLLGQPGLAAGYVSPEPLGFLRSGPETICQYVALPRTQ
jgi:hypothetical protein